MSLEDIGVILAIISLVSAGIWYVIRDNSRKIEAMSESYTQKTDDLVSKFHDDMTALARQYHDDSQVIAKELHQRISQHGTELSEFRIAVAKHHPDRQEMNQAIDNAVAPMLRELQHVRDQVTHMNGNLTQFMQTISAKAQSDRGPNQ